MEKGADVQVEPLIEFLIRGIKEFVPPGGNETVSQEIEVALQVFVKVQTEAPKVESAPVSNGTGGSETSSNGSPENHDMEVHGNAPIVVSSDHVDDEEFNSLFGDDEEEHEDEEEEEEEEEGEGDHEEDEEEDDGEFEDRDEENSQGDDEDHENDDRNDGDDHHDGEFEEEEDDDDDNDEEEEEVEDHEGGGEGNDGGEEEEEEEQLGDNSPAASGDDDDLMLLQTKVSTNRKLLSVRVRKPRIVFFAIQNIRAKAKRVQSGKKLRQVAPPRFDRNLVVAIEGVPSVDGSSVIPMSQMSYDDWRLAEQIAVAKARELVAEQLMELNRARSWVIRRAKADLASRRGISEADIWPWEIEEHVSTVLRELGVPDHVAIEQPGFATDESFADAGIGSRAVNRRLLDIYGDTLRYVNILYNQVFGKFQRKVPAHMPHFVDKSIMAELQSKWSDRYDLTSSHRFRRSDDMQFAFAYFYYTVHRPVEFKFGEAWSEYVDRDRDGVLNIHEIRYFSSFLESKRPDEKSIAYLMEALANGTRACEEQGMNQMKLLKMIPEAESAVAADRKTRPAPSAKLNFVDSLSSLPLLTQAIATLRNHPAIAKQCNSEDFTIYSVLYNEELLEKFKKRVESKHEHPHQVMPMDQVEFYMLGKQNYSDVVKVFDDMKLKAPKFICINDDMKDDNEELVQLLHDFFVSYFPFPSPFELPPSRYHKHNYLHEIMAERQLKSKETWNFVVSAGLAASCLLFVVYRCFRPPRTRRIDHSEGGYQATRAHNLIV